MPTDYFGEEIAARYDDEVEGFDPTVLDPVVDFLVGRARGGGVLELGIGTGGVAVRLRRRAWLVTGMDRSPPRAARRPANPDAKESVARSGALPPPTSEGTFPPAIRA